MEDKFLTKEMRVVGIEHRVKKIKWLRTIERQRKMKQNEVVFGEIFTVGLLAIAYLLVN